MLTIVGGLIRIPIPFTPIVITLQTFFVIASGMILGGKDGAYAQIVYAVLGLIGLPVFSGGGGPSYVIRPSFGYILSFPLAAFLTGFVKSRFKTLNAGKLFASGLAGIAANYIIGIAYQVLAIAVFTKGGTLVAALASVPAVLLMLAKDIILVLILCLIYPRIMTMIGKLSQEKAAEKEPAPTEQGEGEEEKKPEEGERAPKEPKPPFNKKEKKKRKEPDPVSADLR